MELPLLPGDCWVSPNPRPPIPPHLLKHAEAQAKKRRLAALIPPTPAAKRLNSTIDTPTPTKRKKLAVNRLNSTTPTFATPNSSSHRKTASKQACALVKSWKPYIRHFWNF